MHKRESPKSYEIQNRSNTISDIFKSPHQYSPIPEIPSPKLQNIEKRIKDLEELRFYENEKHRKEIERLENMIDKMQQNRKNDPKVEILQKAFDQQCKQLNDKDNEILALKGKIKLEEKKKKNGTLRCTSHESIESQKKQKILVGKPNRPSTNDNKQLENELNYWKTKAYQLSTKYFTALKNMRKEVESIRSDCTNEWKNFRFTYQNTIKKIQDFE